MYYYVYIVQCANNGLYTGITTNVRKRIEQHNGLRWGGAFYTRMHRPVFLVHLERFATKREARRRELELQALEVAEKFALVNATTKQQILSSV
jgi:putative endonuclease